MELQKPEERVVSSPGGNYATVIALVTLSILCAGFVIYRLTPPSAQPVDAPAAGFAASRAMERLKMIARKPHPVGSAEHSEVRDYLLKELTGFGLNPEVQNSVALSQWGGGAYIAASVQNIIGRIKGSDGRQAVMLACHYDSVPTGPGASDDGASVAALLEVIRALKVGPPLKNDVLFLFTDGEELGLLGAKIFMDEHAYAKDVAVALNFEARGGGGPSIMFETSEGNESLVKAFATAGRNPVANSLTYELYRLLSNDTDMTIFKNGGLLGLNFAFIGGPPYYHTARDSYQNIDQDSLQHQGAFALDLARHFGNVGAWPSRGGDAVYFDLFSSILVSYSERWVLPLMALGLALFVGLVILGLRRRRLTIRGILFGAISLLLNVIVVGTLVGVAWLAIRGASSNPMSDDYHNDLYAIGFLLLTVAVSGSLLIWFRKKTRVENLIVGTLLWWVVLMVLICLRIPGGSYLVTWPLLLMDLALGLVFVLREEMTSTKGLALLTLPALSGVILIVPVIRLTVSGLGMEVGWILMAIVVFLFAMHYAHLNLLMTVRKWLLPMVSGTFGLCSIGAAILLTGASVAHPKLDHLFYVLNADSGKAFWGSADQKLDEWTTQFFPGGGERASLAEHLPWGRGTFLKSDAALLPLPTPDVVALDDSKQGELRTLRLRVTSPRRAPAMTIYWKRELGLESLAVNGKRIGEDRDDSAGKEVPYRRLFYFGLPEEGIELSMKMRSSASIELKVEDCSYGLPEIPNQTYRGRPDHIIASPFINSDCTIVIKSVTF
jgi:hypothetical protein